MALQIVNYLTLQNAIASELNRTDLSNEIPLFIQLAEGDIRTDLRGRGVTVLDTLTISAAETVLPTDIRTVRSLYDEFGPVRLAAPEEVARLRSVFPSGSIRPTIAAVIGDKVSDITLLVLMVAPAPQQPIIYTMIYEPEIVALANDSDTNWLLTLHPAAYYYGALKHSAPFLRDDERVPLWDKLYQDNMSKIRRLRDDLEYGAGPLVAMPRRAIGG